MRKLKVLWWVLRGRPVIYRAHFTESVFLGNACLVVEARVSNGTFAGFNESTDFQGQQIGLRQ